MPQISGIGEISRSHFVFRMTRLSALVNSFRVNRNRFNELNFESFNNEPHNNSNIGSQNNRIKTLKVMRAPQYSSVSCYNYLCILLLLVMSVMTFLFYMNVIHFKKFLEEEEHTDIKSIRYRSFDLPPPPKPDDKVCSLVEDMDKFDCYPENGASPANCELRGCCWGPPHIGEIDEVLLNVPYCFYPSNYASYKYVNVTYTPYGLFTYLKRNYRTAYSTDVETILMTVKFETENRLHVKFTDPSRRRFEPPYPEVPVVDNAAFNLSYTIVIDPTKTGFQILRKSDGVIIFDSVNIGNMIFSNQFLQFSGRLPSKYIYGLGEHQSSLLLSTNWQRFTMFNHDGPPTENANLYGSHPFYLSVEPSGNSHGVFLLNSNAMDVILQPKPAITFRTIGGVLDFYFFLGPSPSDVIAQYTELVGRPYMPPYWGLGFHLCRFGYKTLNDTINVLNRNLQVGIQIDTQWNDLDYMDNSNDFTYDIKNYRGLPKFVDDIHKNGRHYVPLIDPGVSASEKHGTYPPFDLGLKLDIFVKNSTNGLFIGKVWNKHSTVWPDFTNPNTVNYWTLMLKSLHDKFPFDGAWIDMNEPSNFLSGSFTGCPVSPLESPPYVPGVLGGNLNDKTMCMTAKHYLGLHYDLHNVYGLAEAIVTNFALSEIRRKRPFIISRSTFPGFGHHAGHWSGDVFSTWKDMKYSIPQLLSFSMFGVPLMGADICGFNGNSTASLCNRWMQLGAFYPFSRNHNSDDTTAQDPAVFGDLVIRSTKKAMSVRYSLLPYLYTLFWKAHVNGHTVARPLFFEFPKDNKTYNIDEQFLWGPAVMIVPVLLENKTSVSPYIPRGLWYDYYTNSLLKSTGQIYNLVAPLDTIPVFIRGGYILPQQQPLATTTATRKSNIDLLVALDESSEAYGSLYWDDGDSLNSYEENMYTLLEFYLLPQSLRSSVISWAGEAPPNLESVTFLGVNTPVTTVSVNGLPHAFQYNSGRKYLVVANLDIYLKQAFVISWK